MHSWTLTAGDVEGVLFYIRRGGVIGVEVTGPRQKSTQVDMGIEIPCMLTFAHEDVRLLEKARELLEKKAFKVARA